MTLEKVEGLKVLIVAEHASAKFGGEAVLPLHYFRQLRRRTIEAWMVVHSRTQEELRALLPGEVDRLFFVRDTWLHALLAKCEGYVSARLAALLFGFFLQHTEPRNEKSPEIFCLSERKKGF